MKVMIIGFSGSGKSTLAKKLAEEIGCEALHMDSVHWLPGWEERPRESEIEITEAFLNTHESWVIDGNYTKVAYERRLEEADVIIEMLLGSVTCYLRVLKRLKQYKGKSRPDMTVGCDEKVDWEFTKWVLHDGRKKSRWKHYREIREKYPEKTVIIRNQRQIDKYKLPKEK